MMAGQGVVVVVVLWNGVWEHWWIKVDTGGQIDAEIYMSKKIVCLKL